MPDRPVQFAMYNWFREHGYDLVHPADLAAFAALMPASRVFGVGKRDGWTVLSLGDDEYRVRPDLLQPVAAPRFWIGDEVGFTSGGKARRGTVREVRWHHDKAAPFYFLSADGKRLSKRYFSGDLAPMQ